MYSKCQEMAKAWHRIQLIQHFRRPIFSTQFVVEGERINGSEIPTSTSNLSQKKKIS